MGRLEIEGLFKAYGKVESFNHVEDSEYHFVNYKIEDDGDDKAGYKAADAAHENLHNIILGKNSTGVPERLNVRHKFTKKQMDAQRELQSLKS